jgi:hypothetical protein
MAEPTLACASYLSEYISRGVFSDMSLYHIASLLHRELSTMTSPAGNSLLKMYAFFRFPATSFLISFPLDETHLDPLSAGCKHGSQPLRPGHGIRSESWTRWQLQLVRCFQGKGAGHRQAVGIQRNESLVGFLQGSLSTWISASTSSWNGPISLNVDCAMLMDGVGTGFSLTLWRIMTATTMHFKL